MARRSAKSTEEQPATDVASAADEPVADAATQAADEPKLSDEHKAALAVGRTQGRAVKAYLEALNEHRPRRGRKRTGETVRRRLETVEKELESEFDPLTRLHLIQERMDLLEELSGLESGVDIGRIEDEFVAVAADYSSRKGITYQAWREAGVSADVLKRAGVGRRG
jgi:hypothetical protein